MGLFWVEPAYCAVFLGQIGPHLLDVANADVAPSRPFTEEVSFRLSDDDRRHLAIEAEDLKCRLHVGRVRPSEFVGPKHLPDSSRRAPRDAPHGQNISRVRRLLPLRLEGNEGLKEPDVTALLNPEHGPEQIGCSQGYLTAETGVPVPMTSRVPLHGTTCRVAQSPMATQTPPPMATSNSPTLTVLR